MAKGMGNGFPVAGIIIAPHIQAKTWYAGHYLWWQPLACAAALAVLEVIEEENLMEQCTVMRQLPDEQLKKIEGIAKCAGHGTDDRL